MSGHHEVKVLARRRYGCFVEVVMEASADFTAEPGQFVHVCCEGPGLILRRPYSLYGVRHGTVSLLVREVGAGSAWLCAVDVGYEIDLLGPLGRGFTVKGRGRHALIAGGTGMATMRFLASRLLEYGEDTTVFWGVDGEEECGGLDAKLAGEFDLHMATMDGSLGYRGSVLDCFLAKGAREYDFIYACGPRGMLAGLAEINARGTMADLQVCMEERMACGIGACRGCVVPAASPAGGYLTVCRDGPVFDGRELDWQRINGEI
ncbi:MAG: dihydroorotate dehydrogenase electron transfer subunit [Actinobacteria bacterium]|nr:dihydroorotate dehydrogenase electron transfer subunit [Actinomycetota bacterium]